MAINGVAIAVAGAIKTDIITASQPAFRPQYQTDKTKLVNPTTTVPNPPVSSNIFPMADFIWLERMVRKQRARPSEPDWRYLRGPCEEYARTCPTRGP